MLVLVKNVSPVHRAPTKPESTNRKRLTQTEKIMMRTEITKEKKKQNINLKITTVILH